MRININMLIADGWTSIGIEKGIEYWEHPGHPMTTYSHPETEYMMDQGSRAYRIGSPRSASDDYYWQRGWDRGLHSYLNSCAHLDWSEAQK